MQDAARADENARAAGVFDEGNLLRIKEAEGRFRLQMVSKTVEQGLLIVPVLHPCLAKIAEVWFAFLLHVKRMFFAQRAHIFAEHPSKRNRWR